MTPEEFRELYASSTKTPLAIAETFSALSEPERKQLSKTVQELFRSAREAERGNWGLPSYVGAIARLAMLACCSWSQARRVTSGARGMFPDQSAWMAAACRILADRRPEWAGDWIALQLEAGADWRNPLTWDMVRTLLRDGVIKRPTTDGYVRLLASRGFLEFDAERDADVLETEIWRLFEVDNHAFEFVPEPRKIDRGKWQRGEFATEAGPLHHVYDGWPRRLYELAHRGQIDRNRLIDSILASLWHDFRGPMRTGLLRFLEILEPTDEEIAARHATYCELLRNSQGPVVGMALKALARVHKSPQFDATGFLAAVPAAFGISSKSQPKSALSLIARVAKDSPDCLPAAVDAVGAALNHESPEVQEQAVELLVKWKADQPSLEPGSVVGKAALLADHHRRRLESPGAPQAVSEQQCDPAAALADDHEPRIKALRERLSALPEWARAAVCLDGIEESLQTGALPPVFDPEPARCPVLSGVEPIKPVRDVDELIDAVAHLFEVVDGADEIERVIDGVMRLGGETTEDFVGKTEGIRHPVFGAEWIGQTPAGMLAWCVPSLLQLIAQWLQTQFREPWQVGRNNDLPAADAFDQRITLLIVRFRKQQFGPVLATPTHRGGWIDPRVFVARLKTVLDAGQIPNRFDLIGGLLRLAPDFRDMALASAADVPAPYHRIVRYALGGDERPEKGDTDRAEEWLAAGRARQPRGNLDDLRILGLSEAEPDGITAVTFQIEPNIDPTELKHAHWSRGHSARCVIVTPDEVVFGGGLTTRPTVGLAARLINDRPVTFVPNWLHELTGSLWPLNPDATLASACYQLIMRMNDKGSMFEPVTGLLAPLQTVDRGWSAIGRTALWLGLLSRDDQARGLAIDALIEGIADGRAHPVPLADTLLEISGGGWMKLNRLADSLREAARTSILAEQVAAAILDRLIASWDALPRDGHHVLTLQLDLLRSLHGAPTENARAMLATVTGSSKAAKLARQLCELTADAPSPQLQEAVLIAVEGRIARGERIARFIERNSRGQ